MAIHIEVVKGVPRPNGVPILVQVDYAIPDNLRRAGIPGKIVELLGEVREHDHVSVGKGQKIMVIFSGNKIKSSGLHLCR